jgi:hypothetical protein
MRRVQQDRRSEGYLGMLSPQMHICPAVPTIMRSVEPNVEGYHICYERTGFESQR